MPQGLQGAPGEIDPLYPLFWRWRRSIRIFLDGSNPLKVPAKGTKMEIAFGNISDLGRTRLTFFVISEVNGVLVARNGLILSQNGATDSRKVSRYLLDLRDALKNQKRPPRSKSQKLKI